MRATPPKGFARAMTDNDTGYAPPPPGYSPPQPGTQAPPRPLLRRTTGDANVLGGVSAGIARWLGIDPILVRVAFVVLTIMGGSGILLYLAGWLFIPEEGRPESTCERFFRNNNALAITAAVVIAVVVVSPMLAWGLWDGGIGFGGIVLLLLAIAGVFALTRRDSSPSGPASPAAVTSNAPTEPTTAASETAPTTVITHPTTPLPVMPPAAPPAPPIAPPPAPPQAQQPDPPQPPPPPREKSVLGRLTLGLALLVTGALVALDMADVIAVDAVTVIASALTVVALGLLVGTFVGRSRGLIALGIVMALALIPLSAIPDGIDWNTGKGVGDRTYRVQTAEDLEAEYALGAGELTLDLRNAELDGVHDVDVSLGAGELIVVLPRDAIPVTVEATVGVGELELPGVPRRDGVSIDESWERQLVLPSGDDAPTASTDAINLTLETGFGAVTVIDEADGTDERLGSR
jgi:phage shock protein PspC (stress-responsive transcriptional regulator)